MGWYQENFPGSPAARQRILLSRGIVIYSIITGGLFYFFSPYCRRIRKEYEEGRRVQDWAWFRQTQESRKIEYRNIIGDTPNVEQLLSAKQDYEKYKRDDLDGPELSTEEIRRVK